ncbi:unnamed protein product [Dovyalis caffra]|uniref:Uncharacterized protein n=1 Tax=Dovyalis caffra TaxID=77055 RepID=A0AAV1QRN2_9ROSI|nr:unnamed protein product [Dovyalis caffra]
MSIVGPRIPKLCPRMHAVTWGSRVNHLQQLELAMIHVIVVRPREEVSGGGAVAPPQAGVLNHFCSNFGLLGALFMAMTADDQWIFDLVMAGNSIHPDRANHRARTGFS